MKYRIVDKCRVCDSFALNKYLSLGEVPLCNNLNNEMYDTGERYPIDVLFCEECFLSQLSIVVNPDILYSNYLYHSSVSKTFKTHCADLAKKLKSEFKFKNDPPTCMDIAANDGALLREFKNEGFVVRGFEPCGKLAKKCWDEDLMLVRSEFFNQEVSRIARSWSGEDIITATNVLAHIDDLDDFIQGVKYQLECNPKGIFIAEVPYLPDLMSGCQYDTIYHEHLSYFLLAPLVEIFFANDLPIFRVERIPIHGGSIRIYASLGYDEEASVEDLLKYEEDNNFYSPSKYEEFSENVDALRASLVVKLADLHNQGKKVMGYGASAKGISLLNYCHIPSFLIHSIVDETPAKQGKFTPGTNIPIVPFSAFEEEKPDVILLLAWNFAEECKRKTVHIGAEYILPI